MAYEAGDVVLVPFPYRDRTAASTRPAVVISCRAYNATNDLVIAAITSHPASSRDYELQDWGLAGLRFPSTVRMLLATVATSRVQLTVGRLSDRDWSEVQQRVRDVFAWP